MSRSDALEDATNEGDAAILEESRRVLDHQIDRIESVDDKAAWTLRIGVVLLGIVVSTVQFTGVTRVNVVTLAGGVSVAFGLLAGILAHAVSSVDFGVGPRQLKRKLPDSYERPNVYDATLDAHDDSIAFNHETLRLNNVLLSLAHLFLIVGVGLLVARFLLSL